MNVDKELNFVKKAIEIHEDSKYVYLKKGDISSIISTLKSEREEKERLESFIEILQTSHFVELQREKTTVERYKKALEEIYEIDDTHILAGGWIKQISHKALGGDHD